MVAKMLSDMIFLTNLTLDADNEDKVRELGLPMGLTEAGSKLDDPTFPLTDAEFALLVEGGYGVAGIDHADLMLGHSVILRGKKCACPTIEFHFRNDKTRERWGSPVTLEEHLPQRPFQSAQVRQVLERVRDKVRSLGGDAAIDLHPIETEDRFALYICIPFDWLLQADIKTNAEFLAFMRGFLQ